MIKVVITSEAVRSSEEARIAYYDKVTKKTYFLGILIYIKVSQIVG